MAAEVTGQPEPRRWWEVRREHTSRKEWLQVLWAVQWSRFLTLTWLTRVDRVADGPEQKASS